MKVPKLKKKTFFLLQIGNSSLKQATNKVCDIPIDELHRGDFEGKKYALLRKKEKAFDQIERERKRTTQEKEKRKLL